MHSPFLWGSLFFSDMSQNGRRSSSRLTTGHPQHDSWTVLVQVWSAAKYSPSVPLPPRNPFAYFMCFSTSNDNIVTILWDFLTTTTSCKYLEIHSYAQFIYIFCNEVLKKIRWNYKLLCNLKETQFNAIQFNVYQHSLVKDIFKALRIES